MSEAMPRREITDAGALRALAHPLRMRLMEELLLLGSATATELADKVGESPANCSWHLRQLAKYGYIEEAGDGAGRQRPWRLVFQAQSSGSPDADPELAAADRAASEVLFDHEYRAFKDRERWKASDPPDWQEAAANIQAVGWLTVDELRELSAEMFALMSRHFDRVADPALRPPGSRLVRMVAWAVPARPISDAAASVPNDGEVSEGGGADA
jgi:DNA-binding transcriptional ArsR family regulator